MEYLKEERIEMIKELKADLIDIRKVGHLGFKRLKIKGRKTNYS